MGEQVRLPVAGGLDVAHDKGDGRDKMDRYYTPEALARAAVRAVVDLDGELPCQLQVLEPNVGGGVWLRAVDDLVGTTWCTAVDVDPRASGLQSPLASESHVGDFAVFGRAWAERGLRWQLVTMNPPFRDVDVHLATALRLAPRVLALVRTAVLQTQGRASLFWGHRPVSAVWLVNGRVSFTGDGKCDQHDHALVYWSPTVGRDRPVIAPLFWR